MGVKGSDITIAKNDGIQAWPTIISFGESPKRPGLLYAGTDDGNVQVSRDTGRTLDQHHRQGATGLPKGIWISEVVPSRFEEGTVYLTADGHRQQRLRVLHLRQQGLRPDVAIGRGEPEGRIGQDAHRGSEESRRAVHRHRDGTLRLARPREELAPHQGEPADRAHRRNHAASARQRDGARHARPRRSGSSITSSRSRSTRRRRRRRRDAKLFTPPPSSMYRRPARDRNYEFWGDHTFYGENPPQAAVISWLNKKQVGEVKLKITDAAGREVRELSGTAFANSNKPGIQSACWDLRVQPAPAPPPQDGRGGAAANGGRPLKAADAVRPRRPESVRRRLSAAAACGRRRRRSAAAARSSAGRTSSAASTPWRWSSTARRRQQAAARRRRSRSRARRRPIGNGSTTWRWRCTRCSRASPRPAPPSDRSTAR